MAKIKREVKAESVANQPRNISYLRVSTPEQSTETNKADILKFANDNGFGVVEWVEEVVSGKVNWKTRKIKQVIDTLGDGDRLIIPEISRLGRSSVEIFEILNEARQKGIAVYAVKNNWTLNGSIESKVMMMMHSIVAEIERDLMSRRTHEGLRAAREKGHFGGRPKGPGRSKLDPFKDKIIHSLKDGVRKDIIAKRCGATPATLFHFLRKHKINITPD